MSDLLSRYITLRQGIGISLSILALFGWVYADHIARPHVNTARQSDIVIMREDVKDIKETVTRIETQVELLLAGKIKVGEGE